MSLFLFCVHNNLDHGEPAVRAGPAVRFGSAAGTFHNNSSLKNVIRTKRRKGPWQQRVSVTMIPFCIFLYIIPTAARFINREFAETRQDEFAETRQDDLDFRQLYPAAGPGFRSAGAEQFLGGITLRNLRLRSLHPRLGPQSRFTPPKRTTNSSSEIIGTTDFMKRPTPSHHVLSENAERSHGSR